jgi:hypothetical protein
MLSGNKVGKLQLWRLSSIYQRKPFFRTDSASFGTLMVDRAMEDFS